MPYKKKGIKESMSTLQKTGFDMERMVILFPDGTESEPVDTVQELMLAFAIGVSQGKVTEDDISEIESYVLQRMEDLERSKSN
jgi:hypothetical protein